ncbi:10336_t:CDS:2 [Funneliformis geosporum]|nr:10336_t:CDS:2 [Funneliformis geosporum]
MSELKTITTLCLLNDAEKQTATNAFSNATNGFSKVEYSHYGSSLKYSDGVDQHVEKEDLLRLIKEDKVEELIFLTTGDKRKLDMFAQSFGSLGGLDDGIKENASDFDLVIDDNPFIYTRCSKCEKMDKTVLAPYYPAVENQHDKEVLLVKQEVNQAVKEYAQKQAEKNIYNELDKHDCQVGKQLLELTKIKETKKELDYFKQELEEGKIPYVLRLKTIKLILKLESEIRKDKEKMENNKKLIDDFEKAKTMKDPELLSILKKHSENLK